jgi:hypothetical protein
MRKTVALLVIACVVVSRDTPAQSTVAKARPYRLAVGMTPEALSRSRLPWGNFGLSVSKDIYQRSRFTLRGDAMSIDGGSALTADLAYNRQVWRLSTYALVGAGWASDGVFLWAAGVDFTARGRPLFAELRSYQRSSGVFRAGVRF